MVTGVLGARGDGQVRQPVRPCDAHLPSGGAGSGASAIPLADSTRNPCGPKAARGANRGCGDFPPPTSMRIARRKTRATPMSWAKCCSCSSVSPRSPWRRTRRRLRMTSRVAMAAAQPSPSSIDKSSNGRFRRSPSSSSSSSPRSRAAGTSGPPSSRWDRERHDPPPPMPFYLTRFHRPLARPTSTLAVVSIPPSRPHSAAHPPHSVPLLPHRAAPSAAGQCDQDDAR